MAERALKSVPAHSEAPAGPAQTPSDLRQAPSGGKAPRVGRRGSLRWGLFALLPVVLIVGMLSTKDCAGFLKNFSGLARRVIAVPIHQDKTVPAAELANIAGSVGIPALARDDIDSAIDVAGKLDLHPAPRILITGSLYLAGEVLAANGTPPQ